MCVLRISGKNLDVDGLLKTMPTSFEVSSVYRRGEPELWTKPTGRTNKLFGINVKVSHAEFSDLPGQIRDARAFLEAYTDLVRAARLFSEVEGITLDFAIKERDVAVQCDLFPAALLALLGTLGIDLEVSCYRFMSKEIESDD